MSRFRYFLRTRYNECDAQKVVFNARYADYTDVATAEFFRAIGYEKELISGELDYQVVKQTTEWRAPARYDQVLEISVSVKNIGTTSLTLFAEFRIAGEERVIVNVETVYVHVDHHTLTKTPIPPALREALARDLSEVTVDHAAHLRSQQLPLAGK